MTRTQKKEGRRAAIIAAAEVLIRKTRGTDFTMKDLAVQAGLSTATTYNLIGTKSTVLYILLNQAIQDLHRGLPPCPPGTAPGKHVEKIAKTASHFFADDPDFYRPLMRYLLGVLDPVNRPIFMLRAYEFWLSGIERLDKAELSERGIDPRDIARVLHLMFAGVLDVWVHEELDAHQFEAQVYQGMAFVLLALNDEPDPALLDQIVRARKITQPAFDAPKARLVRAD